MIETDSLAATAAALLKKAARTSQSRTCVVEYSIDAIDLVKY